MNLKPGYLTTEFWTTIVSTIIAIIAIFNHSVANALSAQTQGLVVIASGLAMAGYSISRGLTKSGVATALSPYLPVTPDLKVPGDTLPTTKI